ncbi:ABC transporter permease [Acidicapsa dinghuensis]|uniref:ABC transporter permease n=1 Tax=Acidicapsa dinghuensis TaxID=2218256 RepID=A0ABW1EJ27_9BACT|nr:ABC transporter permease [Acidicapsa dinghuensis]
MTWKDMVIAGRILFKRPGYTLTAVATIALGIGASGAIFSVTNAVLLRPLPYQDPGQLVIGGMELRRRNVRDLPFSNADFIDLREGTKASFSDMAGVFTGRMIVPREDGNPEEISYGIVTTNFFDVLGSRIVLGRDFVAQDGAPQPKPPANDTTAVPARLPGIAILSYEYFQRRYGGNAAVLGRAMTIPGQPGPLMVGVLAPGFRLYFPPDANVDPAPEIYIANRLDYDAAARNNFSIFPVGRLKSGATLQQAQGAADGIAAQARQTFPINGTAGYYIDLAPMRQHLVAEVRPAILTLMGSVIFLLLIACANVGNLLLVRASLRQQEFSVRAALGANRWRLVSPILAEAVLLSAMGTIVGLALAWAGIRELQHLAPANLPRLSDVRIDGTVVVFSALAGLISASIFGVVPALQASRPALMNVLRGVSRTSGMSSGAFLRNAVVVAEVALSFVLLIGSGLMFRSFLKLQHIDPGFDAHNLLTFQIQGIRLNRKTAEERAAFLRVIEEKLRSISGVQSVSGSFPFPLTGEFSPIRWGTEDAARDPNRFQATDFQIVLPGYFETMHTSLLAGRTFTDEDNTPSTPGQPGRDAVIVDEALAAKAFPGQSAIGQHILIRIRTPQAERVQIIGVVAHQRINSLSEVGREQIYFPDAFLGSGVIQSWALRTGNDPAAYENQVRATIKALDPHLLITKMETADSVVYESQAGTRFSLVLISVFAVIAAVLAGVGLYGVISTSVRQRTAEIGVRMAMGAERGDILRLVVAQGMRLSVVGIAIGLIGSLLLGRVISALLVGGVKPTDATTFAGMTVGFLAISAFACWLPARRASILDPAKALREQ